MNNYIKYNLDTIIQDLHSNNFIIETKIYTIRLNSIKFAIFINPKNPLKAFSFLNLDGCALAADIDNSFLIQINKALKDAMYQNVFTRQDETQGNIDNALKLIDYDIGNFNFINIEFSSDTERKQFIEFIKNKPLNKSLLLIKDLFTSANELEAVKLILKNAYIYGDLMEEFKKANKN